MIHMHPEALLIGRNDPAQERNLMHLVALREAKISSEYRQSLIQTADSGVSVRRPAIRAAATASARRPRGLLRMTPRPTPAVATGHGLGAGRTIPPTRRPEEPI